MKNDIFSLVFQLSLLLTLILSFYIFIRAIFLETMTKSDYLMLGNFQCY
uniref:Uncharacterized protein n=1 Tax=viral metagenome TaxID=1070528 RepID=A0A6C0JXT3_9ZZZZ